MSRHFNSSWMTKFSDQVIWICCSYHRTEPAAQLAEEDGVSCLFVVQTNNSKQVTCQVSTNGSGLTLALIIVFLLLWPLPVLHIHAVKVQVKARGGKLWSTTTSPNPVWLQLSTLIGTRLVRLSQISRPHATRAFFSLKFYFAFASSSVNRVILKQRKLCPMWQYDTQYVPCCSYSATKKSINKVH